MPRTLPLTERATSHVWGNEAPRSSTMSGPGHPEGIGRALRPTTFADRLIGGRRSREGPGQSDGLQTWAWPGLGPLMPRADRGMATHAAWIARDFGRPDLPPFSTAELEELSRILELVEVEAGQKIPSARQ